MPVNVYIYIFFLSSDIAGSYFGEVSFDVLILCMGFYRLYQIKGSSAIAIYFIVLASTSDRVYHGWNSKSGY